MYRYLPFLLLLGFVSEIASIIWVGQTFGVLATLVLLLGNIFVGLTLLRSAGANMVETLTSPRQSIGLRMTTAGSAMFRVMSGILFMVPGFFSDLVAILLLVAPVQRWLAPRLWIEEHVSVRARPNRYGPVIEGEAIEITGEVLPPEPFRRDN